MPFLTQTHTPTSCSSLFVPSDKAIHHSRSHNTLPYIRTAPQNVDHNREARASTHALFRFTERMLSTRGDVVGREVRTHSWHVVQRALAAGGRRSLTCPPASPRGREGCFPADEAAWSPVPTFPDSPVSHGRVTDESQFVQTAGETVNLPRYVATVSQRGCSTSHLSF